MKILGWGMIVVWVSVICVAIQASLRMTLKDFLEILGMFLAVVVIGGFLAIGILLVAN